MIRYAHGRILMLMLMLLRMLILMLIRILMLENMLMHIITLILILMLIIILMRILILMLSVREAGRGGRRQDGDRAQVGAQAEQEGVAQAPADASP